ncbi:DnaJ family molecular chaperone [Xanthomonas theicola]|uniref:J domain-containing protein n=1 Tax=Xanthomonas theicola TaxID=56464 RepID=UPI00361C60E0
MHWYGKLLGAIAGALLLRPNPVFGAALGLLIGHALDADWFKLGQREDPYRELGVTRDASDAEIELAYRRLISQYHPDKVAGGARSCARAEKKASQLNTAYDRIRTLRKR